MKLATALIAPAIACCALATAPAPATAQAETIGAISGAIAAQQMQQALSDMDAAQAAALAAQLPPAQREATCARIRGGLAKRGLSAPQDPNLAAGYLAACPTPGAR